LNFPSPCSGKSCCKIYAYDAHAATRVHHLPAHKHPKSWSERHRYSTEIWLNRAIATHPWRVSSMSDADIIFVVADWSLLCSAGKTFSGRHLWRKVLEDRMLWPGESCKPTMWSSRTPARCGGPPKAISLQYPACPPWVDNNRTAYVPSDVLVLTEYRLPTRLTHTLYGSNLIVTYQPPVRT